MFCENCGIKAEKDAKFCQNCGKKINNTVNTVSYTANNHINVSQFYSEDWRQMKIFAVSSLPYFDIMADKDYLYLIKLPKSSSGTIGLIIGLFLFNFLGAIIGASIGNSSDTKKRKRYRAVWIDLDNKLISQSYEKNIFLKIPKSKLRNTLILKKNKFTLNYNNKSITFKKSKKEYERFNKFIKNYVLY